MSRIDLAKKLLTWKNQRLRHDTILTREEIGEYFAAQFVVVANERRYDANYDNYLEFLNGFKANIEELTHHVYEYFDAGNTIAMPMRPTITYVTGEKMIFEAAIFLTYDDHDKIIEWREVCVKVEIE